MNKNLLIGFGSDILSDRRVIPRLIKDVSLVYADNIDFTCELINNLDLINLFEGYNKLLIIDSVQNPKLEIGSMQYFAFENYQPGLHLENYHDSSLPETIETAKKLGFHVPGKIGIAIINVKEIHTLSTSFSYELNRKYPELLQQLKTLINRFFLLNSEKLLVVD